MNRIVVATLLASLSLCPGCCFGGGNGVGSSLSGEDPRDRAFAQLINDFVTVQSQALRGAPVPDSYRCPVGRLPLEGDEADRTTFGAVGSNPTIVTGLVVQAIRPGSPGAGLDIRLIVRSDGQLGWVDVGPSAETGYEHPLDQAFVVSRVPALNDIVARTVEGLASCSLPRASVADVATTVPGQPQYVASYPSMLSPAACQALAGRDAASLQVSSVTMNTFFTGNGNTARVSSSIGRTRAADDTWVDCFLQESVSTH